MIKLTHLIKEGKYPKTQYKRDDKFKYTFKLFLKGGEKESLGNYDLAGAKKMKQILTKDKVTFEIGMVDTNGYVNDVNI